MTIKQPDTLQSLHLKKEYRHLSAKELIRQCGFSSIRSTYDGYFQNFWDCRLVWMSQ